MSKGNRQYFQLNHQTGDLLLHEKLDREELCGPAEPCILQFQILLQNPLQFITNELQVTDVNDHSPAFSENEMQLKILENTPPGTIIPLGNAEDLDVGRNSLQNYTIDLRCPVCLAVHLPLDWPALGLGPFLQPPASTLQRLQGSSQVHEGLGCCP